MSNDVQAFENKYLSVMAGIAAMTKQEKELAEKNKKMKTELEAAMDEFEIKSIDNEFLKITRVSASTSKSLDIKKLQDKEPALYGELMEDYPKVTNKNAYIKITVK